ncbi:MAG: outer membrane beta-barrel protein [Ignavibacteria bacterium]|nr:outer membrane beta-barrel protein [Ignavibacteria bacterium]
MKISTFVRCMSVAFIAALCVQTASAQSPANSSGMSPDRQMGVGLTAGNSLGGHFAYALNPGFHLGAGFGIALTSVSHNGGGSNSGNMLFFAPYAKFLFSGMKDMKPYIFGSFNITSGKSANEVNSSSSTETGLNIGGGAEYFPSRNVGIYGHLTIIGLGFGDISTTNIGLLSTSSWNRMVF